MAVTLEEVKAYLRVDVEEDDALIQSLMEAAAGYLAAAGIPDSPDSRYVLAVKGLVLHWYDHRGEANAQTYADFPAGLRLTINQLKMEQAGCI